MYVSYHYTQLFNLNKLSHCLAQDSNYVPTITVCHDEANILTEITNMVMVPNKDTKTTTGRKTMILAAIYLALQMFRSIILTKV